MKHRVTAMAGITSVVFVVGLLAQADTELAEKNPPTPPQSAAAGGATQSTKWTDAADPSVELDVWDFWSGSNLRPYMPTSNSAGYRDFQIMLTQELPQFALKQGEFEKSAEFEARKQKIAAEYARIKGQGIVLLAPYDPEDLRYDADKEELVAHYLGENGTVRGNKLNDAFYLGSAESRVAIAVRNPSTAAASPSNGNTLERTLVQVAAADRDVSCRFQLPLQEAKLHKPNLRIAFLVKVAAVTYRETHNSLSDEDQFGIVTARPSDVEVWLVDRARHLRVGHVSLDSCTF